MAARRARGQGGQPSARMVATCLRHPRHRDISGERFRPPAIPAVYWDRVERHLENRFPSPEEAQ